MFLPMTLCLTGGGPPDVGRLGSPVGWVASNRAEVTWSSAAGSGGASGPTRFGATIASLRARSSSDVSRGWLSDSAAVTGTDPHGDQRADHAPHADPASLTSAGS